MLGNRLAGGKGLRTSGMYAWKILPVMALNFIARIVLQLPIHDFHQGFRVYTRSMLKKINYTENSNNYLFSFEILAQAAYHRLKIVEVPVETVYTGEKRGASLRHSVMYSLGTFRVLLKYVLAKLFRKGVLFVEGGARGITSTHGV